MADPRQISNEALGVKIDNVKDDVGEIKDHMGKLADAISVLASVEERQADHGRRLDSHSERIGKIEVEMPGLRETRRWVIAGVLGIVAMIGAGFLTDHIAIRPPQAFTTGTTK